MPSPPKKKSTCKKISKIFKKVKKLDPNLQGFPAVRKQNKISFSVKIDNIRFLFILQHWNPSKNLTVWFKNTNMLYISTSNWVLHTKYWRIGVAFWVSSLRWIGVYILGSMNPSLSTLNALLQRAIKWLWWRQKHMKFVITDAVYFDHETVWWAPVHWLKYTTHRLLLVYLVKC